MNEIKCKIIGCDGSVVEWEGKKYFLRCNKCNRQYRKCQRCNHLWLKRDLLNPTIVCSLCKSPYWQNSKKEKWIKSDIYIKDKIKEHEDSLC